MVMPGGSVPVRTDHEVGGEVKKLAVSEIGKEAPTRPTIVSGETVNAGVSLGFGGGGGFSVWPSTHGPMRKYGVLDCPRLAPARPNTVAVTNAT
jgi:hypothetical protein